MFTSISSLIAKSRALINNEFTSEHQRIVADMLYDDNVEVLTTFDMNRVASLSFGDEVCGDIFDLLEYTLRHPVQFTALSLQKTIILIQHIAIYGSQKGANSSWMLKQFIKPFIEYNTVLLAHSNPNSLMATIQRIKGGSVDHGLPVRTIATKVYNLFDNVENLRKERGQSADPNSLVPIGSKEETAFVSDNVRKAILDEKIKKEQVMRTKSNLGQSHAGFGAGYGNAVGAAHGLEEMLKMANKTKGSFRDEGYSKEEQQHFEHLDMLENELKQKKDEEKKTKTKKDIAPQKDLLDMGSSAQTNTLLAFGQTYPNEESYDKSQLPFPEANEEPTMATILDRKEKEADLFDSTSFTTSPTVLDSFGNTTSSAPTGSEDLLGLSGAGTSSSNSNNNGNVGDLLDMMGSTSISTAPVLPSTSTFEPIPQQAAHQTQIDPFNSNGSFSTTTTTTSTYPMANPTGSASAILSMGFYGENQGNNFQDGSNGNLMPSATIPSLPQGMPPPLPAVTSEMPPPPPSSSPPSVPSDMPPSPPSPPSSSPPPMGGSVPDTSKPSFQPLETVTAQANASHAMPMSAQGMPNMMPNQNNMMTMQQQQMMMQNMMMMMSNQMMNNPMMNNSDGSHNMQQGMGGSMPMSNPQQQAQLFQQMQTMMMQMNQQGQHQSTSTQQSNVDQSQNDNGYPASSNQFSNEF